MRYFEIKQNETEIVDGQNLILDYKKQIKDIMNTAESKSVENFFRLSELFKKINASNTNDFVEIEDQDYSIIKETLQKYITKINGIAAQSSNFSNFIKYVNDLPTKKIEKDPVEQVLSEIREGAI